MFTQRQLVLLSTAINWDRQKEEARDAARVLYDLGCGEATVAMHVAQMREFNHKAISCRLEARKALQ